MTLAIIFLCGSLEPNKDGVGDYTRRLAAELIRMGQHAFIIAINDLHVINPKVQQFPTQSELQDCDGLKVPVLRIGRFIPWQRRVRLIQAVINDLSPQWISLQYVPHAYSHKGVPIRLPHRLHQLECNSRWHVMFHELWGAKVNQLLVVRKIITWIQRSIIANLNRKLPISVAHTSISHWRNLLEAEDIRCRILPLISNIPVVSKDHSSRKALLAGLEIFEPDAKAVILTFFGSIRFDWASMGLVDRVQEVLKRSRWKHAVFVSVGSAGEVGEIIWRSMATRASAHCHFLKLGMLPPEQISQVLQLSDVGVAMNHPKHVGKSGCVAAMADHGLPVILPKGDSCIPESDTFASPIRLIPFDHNFETALLSSARSEPTDSVNQIAMDLARSLYCSI